MIVLDVSAAASMVREGVEGRIFSRIGESGERVIAPSFFRVEAMQVAWKLARAQVIADRDVELLARSIIGYVDEFVPDEELAAEALSEATRLGHSVYDMLYFVLARRTAAPLLTCDHALARLCEENGLAHMAFVEC